jgi:hypothetical protein
MSRGDGGAARRARRREERARREAEDRARRDAERARRDMMAQESANQARLAQIQSQNEAQARAMEQTMAANVAEMQRTPTTIKRKARKKRGQATRGLDRLRIAMSEQGTSTNLG